MPGQLARSNEPAAFLNHFGLTSHEIVEAVRVSKGEDSRIESWFNHKIGPASKTDWNELALNLGREGYPMADTLPRAKRVHHCDDPGVDTCFKLLDWDEGRL